MKVQLVVTRHPALVEYLREIGLADEGTEVISHATPDVVRGKRVCGVLPHSLSALCETFTEVPLVLPPELRGKELTIEEIRKHAGDPVTYRVLADTSVSTDIVELVRASSTNGRWGLVVLGPKGCDLYAPQEGRMEFLGTIERRETFLFWPEVGSNKWFLVGGDVVPLAGATIVKKISLQSNEEATVILGGSFFAVRSYGYKRRSQAITCYLKGQEIKASAAVLAAMGVIPCTSSEVQAEVPKLESGLAAALKAAGLFNV